MEHQANPTEETSEIVLRLETYEDIYSVFDIRPYSRRALSVDFLDEVRRAASDKGGGEMELALLVPESRRNEHHEVIIRERLVRHFKKHHTLLQGEKHRIRKFGMSMVAAGIACLMTATFILFKNSSESFLSSFLVVLLEPAAWFLLWEGMDQVVFTSRNVNQELAFYSKMSDTRVRVCFKSY